MEPIPLILFIEIPMLNIISTSIQSVVAPASVALIALGRRLNLLFPYETLLCNLLYREIDCALVMTRRDPKSSWNFEHRSF